MNQETYDDLLQCDNDDLIELLQCDNERLSDFLDNFNIATLQD